MWVAASRAVTWILIVEFASASVFCTLVDRGRVLDGAAERAEVSQRDHPGRRRGHRRAGRRRPLEIYPAPGAPSARLPRVAEFLLEPRFLVAEPLSLAAQAKAAREVVRGLQEGQQLATRAGTMASDAAASLLGSGFRT